MTVPPALGESSRRVEASLRRELDAHRERWTAVDPLLSETIATLELLVFSGGKRIRPAMAYWSFIGAGGDPDAIEIADLGAALELLQAFALFHDDVMDGSLTRRGQPTAHEREIDRHARAGWRGEDRRYGEAVAILAGDISLVLADVLLARAPAAVRDLWNDLRIEVNLGQFLDVVGTVRGEVTAETADRIVEYKTARYTIVRPLQMGAALAGRTDLIDPLAAVGTPLGIAFQLQDDLLGAFGDTARTGKPVGDDLIEGKPTPLLLRARSRADTTQAEILDRVGGPHAAAELALIQEALRDTGAVADIERQIDAFTVEARTALTSSGLTAHACDQLDAIAHYLADRSS